METHTPNLNLFITFAFTMMLISSADQNPEGFTYNGFKGAQLHLDGSAKIHQNGLLELAMSNYQKGQAMYPLPLKVNSSPLISTTFAFAICPRYPDVYTGRLVFLIAPSMYSFQNFPEEEDLSFINSTANGNFSNYLFYVELSTNFLTVNLEQVRAESLGTDPNGPTWASFPLSSFYFDKEQGNANFKLTSGKAVQVWVDYYVQKVEVSVAIAPLGKPKPRLLLTQKINRTEILLDTIYVGFSATSISVSDKHYILGWSFNQRGFANNLNPLKLPSLPSAKKRIKTIIILVTIVSTLLIIVVSMTYAIIRRKKHEQVREYWKERFAIQSFSYKELYKATKGFKDTELLGAGGFGEVYKGTLSSTNVEVAVKRVSPNSRQGMKEFVSEIDSMRRLRHRNLARLFGYCRRRGELLLVYEYMPNGNVDRFLFEKEKPTLSWPQRLRIIKGVASALLYMHEEWEQVVLHRDVKASNILLDANMEARLGDFGLARLYDHGTDYKTTHVVGTFGYIAPEIPRTGKATTRTDVFAFGTFVLVMACGKRPSFSEDVILIEWVWECWKSGALLKASDPHLEGEYKEDEMEMVLKVGLLCTQPTPEARPSMKQAMQFLNEDAKLPEMPLEIEEFHLFPKSTGTSASLLSDKVSTIYTCSTTDSILKHGR